MQQRSKLILAVLITSVLAGCEEEVSSGGRGGWGGAANVITEVVERQHIVDEIEALGTARANESVEIRPRISSLVESVAFSEGQTVAAGDILVQLEDNEEVAGLALAEASLSESRSLYNRSLSLADTQAISASDLEQLLAQVRVDEASVEAAKARLANTVIHAPFSGRVGLRRVSPGSFVNSSTVITTLDDVSTIKLDFSVPETFLTVLSEGMNIHAESLVYPDREFMGTVSSIDTRLDPVSRAVQVRAVLPNDDGLLKPGMFMSIALQRDRGEVVVAPEQSIVPEGGSQFVYVVNDGIAEKRRVVLGRRIPGFVAIDSGLEAGEQIIVSGTQKVRHGSEVQVPGQAAEQNPAGRPESDQT